jgi:cell wall-associated NlpC family hydrolase
MVYLTPTVITAMHAEAARQAPREMCGVLVRAAPDTDAVFVPCANVAQGNAQFEIDAAGYARAEERGAVVAIVHSHPNDDATPSAVDRAACDAGGVPWLVIAHPSHAQAWLAPWAPRPPNSAQALPLLGRVFEQGVVDCYTLMRDWYFQRHRLSLGDYRRDYDWWRQGGDLFSANFAAEGFVTLPAGAPLLAGDTLCMRFRSPVVNHVAIYLGEDQIIQHLARRLSAREVYGGYWARHTVGVQRHRALSGTP